MLTCITFFLCFFLAPMARGTSVGFHWIKEKERYRPQNLPTPLLEKIINYTCAVILISLLYLELLFPAFISHPGLVLGTTILILVIFYCLKIGKSLYLGSPVTVLIAYALYSKRHKVIAMAVCTWFLIVALENLHIIHTYLW